MPCAAVVCRVRMPGHAHHVLDLRAGKLERQPPGGRHLVAGDGDGGAEAVIALPQHGELEGKPGRGACRVRSTWLPWPGDHPVLAFRAVDLHARVLVLSLAAALSDLPPARTPLTCRGKDPARCWGTAARCAASRPTAPPRSRTRSRPRTTASTRAGREARTWRHAPAKPRSSGAAGRGPGAGVQARHRPVQRRRLAPARQPETPARQPMATADQPTGSASRHTVAPR